MSKKVVIIGGGVAGMSAAHELIERGYQVEVVEKQPVYVGGKARSVDVPDSAKEGKKPLPGEHGFRFFPGFYRHITDTMKRIPFKENKNGVLDNLVPSQWVMMARFDEPPLINIVNFPKTLRELEVAIHALVDSGTGLTKEDGKHFAGKLWQLMTSCYERRNDEYERIAWWDFMDADNQSEAYRQYFVGGITRTLVAAKPKKVSTKTGGDILLQLIFLMSDPMTHADRVLNGPTNDAWLYPWRDYLLEKGVSYHHASEAKEVLVDDGKIAGVKVKSKDLETTITGDHYIFATPVERMAELLNDDLRKLDPTLSYLEPLAKDTAWMTGIQYYLNVDVKMTKGHVMYTDSPWALTSISQLQFWEGYDIKQHGNGEVRGVLSVDVSDWDSPGLNGKAAKDCDREEIKQEVWEQLKKSLIVDGQSMLSDDMLVDWYLDRDIVFEKEFKTVNEEPLLINRVNTWSLRPNAYTNIPNMYLASDYVRTYTDLATMEGANEAARRAVNDILSKEDHEGPDCKIWHLHEPDILAPLRAHDKKRYDKGLPWKKIEVFGSQTAAEKKRTWWVLGLMALSIGALILDSLLGPSILTAELWGYGFTLAFAGLAFSLNDNLLKKLLLFGVLAGFAELVADHYLVNTTKTLLYPPDEPMLWASPAYMPFSWCVVLVEFGYIAWLLLRRLNYVTAGLALAVLGALLVPLYEHWAISAGWWSYQNTGMWGPVPYYIILAEGLLMLPIPLMVKKLEAWKTIRVAGLSLAEGAVMLLACIIAYMLLG